MANTAPTRKQMRKDFILGIRRTQERRTYAANCDFWLAAPYALLVRRLALSSFREPRSIRGWRLDGLLSKASR